MSFVPELTREDAMRLTNPRTAIASLGIAATLLLVSGVAHATVISPAGGTSNTTSGMDAARGCVYAGWDYLPGTTGIAAGPTCYTTPDNSTIPRLATVNPSKTLAQLTAVQSSSPLAPASYLAAGSMATADVTAAPRAANSAAIATLVQDLPVRYLPDTFKPWLRTSINAGNGVGGNDNIPIYTVDSSNRFQEFATFSTTDGRVTTSPKLLDLTSGKIPIPSWATPSAGGDHALAILDKGTGILRGYFGVTRVGATATYANASYLYTNGTGVTQDNYWLNYIQGSNSVIGVANELTQIGAAEVAAGSINHMVSVTFPSVRSGVLSFPAKAGDGKLTDTDAPVEGQVFTFPASLNIDSLGLSPLSTMIAKAVQKHGGIVADQNYWTMAFNLESPKGMVPGTTNPWASGGAAYAKLGGNLNVNDFPWSKTDWLPVSYAGQGGTAPTPTPTPTPTAPTDTVAPVASMIGLAPVSTASSVRLTWSAADAGGSGVASYDVRYSTATVSGSFGSYTYPVALQATRALTYDLPVVRGGQYCASVRARDAVGNLGAWTTDTCSAIVLDDRALAVVKGSKWTQGTSTLDAYGTLVSSVRSGSSLELAGVSTKQLGIVATTCSGCGSADVYIGTTFLGTVNLGSTATAHQQVFWLPVLTSPLAGTVKITTRTNAKVIIDGLLIRH
jgi:hypothetical protein